jgi:flagellar hook-basal body complex protein FliE
MAAVLSIAGISAAVGTPSTPSHVTAPDRAIGGFGDLLSAGIAAADARVARADALIAAFAQGGTVPVHEVTLALEQARLSVELATEVRSRLLEAYRDFMNMQL